MLLSLELIGQQKASDVSHGPISLGKLNCHSVVVASGCRCANNARTFLACTPGLTKDGRVMGCPLFGKERRNLVCLIVGRSYARMSVLI